MEFNRIKYLTLKEVLEDEDDKDFYGENYPKIYDIVASKLNTITENLIGVYDIDDCEELYVLHDFMEILPKKKSDDFSDEIRELFKSRSICPDGFWILNLSNLIKVVMQQNASSGIVWLNKEELEKFYLHLNEPEK